METKRKRAPNYSAGEKELLISLVGKYKMVIENKKTDAVMVSEKNEAWFKITQEFNSISPNNVFRPTDSLKKYWDNIKEDLRRRAGQDRMNLYKTGGGPPSPKLKKPEEDILLDIINKKTIMGLENPCDSDCIDENAIAKIIGTDRASHDLDNNILRSSSPNNEIEIVYEEESLQQQDTTSDVNGLSGKPSHNWAVGQTKPADLRSPLSSPLDKNITMIKGGKTNSKLKEKGSAKLQRSQPTKRRPTTIRVLSSSNLAAKYNDLIEKKLQLAECLMKEHEIRMKLLGFDVALKRKELKLAGYSDTDILLLESCELTI